MLPLFVLAALAAAPPRPFDLGGQPAWSLAFSPDGARLAVGCGDATVRVLDVATGKLVHRLTGAARRAEVLAFSNDGRLLASADDRIVRLWDARAGKPLRSLEGHTSAVVALLFTPDGKGVVSAGRADGVHHWTVADGKRRAIDKLSRTRGRPVALAVTRADRVAVLYRPQVIEEWPTAGGEPSGRRALAPTDPKEANRLLLTRVPPDRGLFLPGGRGAVAVAAQAGGGRVWPLGTAESGRELPTQEGESVWALAASPSGRLLALGTDRGRVAVVEAGSGRSVFSFRAGAGEVKAVAFSPCGRRVAVGFWEAPGVRLCDLDAAASPLPPAGTPQEREARWAELHGDDAPAAYRAFAALAASGDAALLAAKLRPEDAERKRIDGLAADLASDDFAARERAEKELTRLGPSAEPSLRRMTATGADLEGARRAARLLKPFDGVETWTRRGRALDVLERLGTKEARDLLKHLAAGPDRWWLTVEAGEALERLGRRR